MDHDITNGAAERIAIVMREIAEMEALDAATALQPRSRRPALGPSVVFSLRLDRAELEALERRAAGLDVKPSVLARNLIRLGLSTRSGEGLERAVQQVEEAVRELRALVP